MNIPQITRDKIASSVVGTPGVDTSGMAIGQSIAKGADEVAQPIWEYAINRQQNLDLAETNRLTLDYKLKAMDTLEKLKTTYAGEPEKVGPVFEQYLKSNLKDTTKLASNPRVALSVGTGRDTSFFDGILIRQQQAWAYKQRNDLNYKSIIDQGNDVIAQAESMARSNAPYFEKMNYFKPLASAVGTLVAGAGGVVSPKGQSVLEAKMLPTLYTRVAYGMMESGNPAQAVALSEDKEVQKAFEDNPKELDTLHKLAMGRVEGMAKEQEWHTLITPLIDSPKLFADISSGKTDWTTLQSMPDSFLKTQLENLALKSSPENVAEKAEVASQFFADIHDMGSKYKRTPADTTVSNLLKLQDESLHALNEGFITKQTFQTIQNTLAIPLRDAVLKIHDPETLKKVHASGGLMSLFGGKKEAPDEAVDKYVGGYNTINSMLKMQGKDKDWQYKSDVIKKYIDMWNSAKPEDRDSQGRPYNPQSMAYKAMGMGVGDSYPTRYGPRKIVGYDSSGPIMDMSDDDIERMKQDKLQKALRK